MILKIKKRMNPQTILFRPGSDMAKFMLAHLNNGIYIEARILESECHGYSTIVRDDNIGSWKMFINKFFYL
ncbi:MAG: hypothetical protein ACQERL_11290 [Bacillota bacterium]